MEASVRSALQSLRRFPILYGIAWALFYAVMGTLLISLWAHVGTLSDAHIVIAAYIIHCVSVLFGAIVSSRATRERGWYYGGVVGLSYAILMIGIGLIVYNTFSIDAGGLFRVGLMALIGAFGGIIGVNTGRD